MMEAKKLETEMFGYKKVIGALSPKGGVGKSFFCRVTAAVMIEKYGQENVVLIDADHRVNALKKTYGDDCQSINLSKQKGRDQLIAIAEEIHTQGLDKHILIDFAGGSMEEIQELMAGDKDPSAFFDLLKEFGFDPTIAVSFNYELNSQLAFKDIYQAFGKSGVNASYFFVQNCKGIQDEGDIKEWFDGYDGTMTDIELHDFYSQFIPRNFAIEHLGLDTQPRDMFGTTSNLFRAPAMPGTLAKWIHDAVKFDEARFCKFPQGPHRAATRYFDKVKSRLLTTDLLKSSSGVLENHTPEVSLEKPVNPTEVLLDKPANPNAKYGYDDLQAELQAHSAQ